MTIPLNGFDREEHDGNLHAKNVSIVGGSLSVTGQATVNINGSATLYAVVNTGAVSDPHSFIGLTTTVLASAPTIYAVVNTSAAGVGQSIVTVANQVTQFQEDTPHTSGDTGTFALAVRNSSNSVLTNTDGDYSPISVDDTGRPQVVIISGQTKVFGTVSSGNADSGEPVKIGGKYNVTPPTFADGNRGDVQLDVNGRVLVSAPTIYAVVNTSAAGVGQSIVTVANPVSIAGNLTISDSKGFIGLTTVNIGSSNTVTLGTGLNWSGFATVDVINAWPDPKTFIGLVTVVQSSAVRSVAGNVTLSDSKTYIGLVTATVGNTITVNAHGITGNVTLSNSQNFIGLVTVGNTVSVLNTGAGNVTLSDAKTFIGLVTATSLNAGTTKTLIPIPVTLSTSSQATIAVPATNLSIYVTSLLLSSDATVRVSIKSGITYLTGNASIGITLNPGGGWVQAGSPDAPVYRSTPSASINIEKFDMTATKANLGGTIIYYTE